jgi:hypothetical protein
MSSSTRGDANVDAQHVTNPSERVRFNWGFHDGVAAEQDRRIPNFTPSTHHDYAYERGYWAGRVHVIKGDRINTSEAAWVDFRLGVRYHAPEVTKLAAEKHGLHSDDVRDYLHVGGGLFKLASALVYNGQRA